MLAGKYWEHRKQLNLRGSSFPLNPGGALQMDRNSIPVYKHLVLCPGSKKNYVVMKSSFDLSSLPVQMILSFIAIVIFTTAAVGLPAIWLIRDQLDRQAWSQVDQGQRASLALYGARQNEVKDLAILSAQRPTLKEFLDEKNWMELNNYLVTLMTGAGLDLVAVCGISQDTISSTADISTDVCQTWQGGDYQTIMQDSRPWVWLTAMHPIEVPQRHRRKFWWG